MNNMDFCKHYDSGICIADRTICNGNLLIQQHTPFEAVAYCTDKKIASLVLDYRKWLGRVGD